MCVVDFKPDTKVLTFWLKNTGESLDPLDQLDRLDQLDQSDQLDQFDQLDQLYQLDQLLLEFFKFR